MEKYCFGFREYLVDLVGKPGHLWEPDSLLNGLSTISISSPLRFPRPRPVEPAVDYRSLAKQYFTDSQSLNLVFDPASGYKNKHEQYFYHLHAYISFCVSL